VTLLAQQELVEPAPVRRLIVPQQCGSWWGVDPSTVRLSVAYVTPEGERGVRTVPFARADGPARLSEIYAQTRLFARRACVYDGFPLPGLVMVEQPSGKMENPNLSYAVGVIQAATWAVLGRCSMRVRIETCTSSWWKKRACGRGNIYKPKKRAEEYGVVTWARQNGYAGCRGMRRMRGGSRRRRGARSRWRSGSGSSGRAACVHRGGAERGRGCAVVVGR
jgi:hypothetical protein